VSRRIYLYIYSFLPLFDTFFPIVFNAYLSLSHPKHPTNLMMEGEKGRGSPGHYCYNHILNLLNIFHTCSHLIISIIMKRVQAVVQAIHCVPHFLFAPFPILAIVHSYKTPVAISTNQHKNLLFLASQGLFCLFYVRFSRQLSLP
jgi:hypothetical protein